MAQFLDFMDMINGGGAGRSGQRFEGGGLLSGIANAVATPYGSQQGLQASPRPMQRPQMAQPAPAMPMRPQAPQQQAPQVSGPAIKEQFYNAMRQAQLDPATVEANPQIYQQLLTAFIRNGGRLPPLNNRPSNSVQMGF